jgi:hypothetical protein
LLIRSYFALDDSNAPIGPYSNSMDGFSGTTMYHTYKSPGTYTVECKYGMYNYPNPTKWYDDKVTVVIMPLKLIHIPPLYHYFTNK